MGADIHIRITKYDSKTNLYRELELFKKKDTSYEKIFIDGGRNYEMFEGMKNGTEENGYGFFPWCLIHFLSLEPPLGEELNEKLNTPGFYDFREIILSEFKLYLLEHPTVVDYEGDWTKYDKDQNENLKPRKENPITYLFDDIINYISLADEDWSFTPYSYYKIIFFFDR